MLEQKIILVNNKEVMIQQLGGSLALKHSIILGKLVGGLAQGIDSKGKKSVQDWDIDFGKMVDGIISNLDPEESPAWIKLLVSQSMIKPECTDTWFDTEFSANLEGLVEMLKAILEFNYGGLFEYLRKKIEAAPTLGTSSEDKGGKPGKLAPSS